MAEDFWRSLTKDVLKNALWDAIKLALGLACCVATSLFASRLLVFSIASLDRFKWYLAIIFGTGSAWLFLFLEQRYSRYRPTFPRLDFDFLVLEKEITYEYTDRTHMTYRKRNRLKALKSGLDTYYDKYLWTGKGSVNIQSAVQEQQIIETIRKNVFQVYEIRFQKSLAKGEEIETEVVWTLEDVEKKAVPFFSATIEEPTDLIKLNLVLAPALGVKQVTREISASIGAKKPAHSSISPLNKHGEYTWEVKRPKLLHYYEVKWVFNEGKRST